MPPRLGEVVHFRGDRLFDGAVNIGWFGSDVRRSRAASQAFVFHGPQYHGVQQDEVGTSHGHSLVDTASFSRALVRQCYGEEDQPFTLAIAGYGTGKSHLGLTLATLLSDPDSKEASAILAALEAADDGIGGELRALLRGSEQPCLVVALNGMQSFNLAAEVTSQITRELARRGLDTKPVEDLRPRFQQAANLITVSSKDVVSDLLKATGLPSANDVVAALARHDEGTYTQVHEFFAGRGVPITALAGESIRDVIDVTLREYCGPDKPFRSLAILFDEFGRFTEFATVRSVIAGSGVLQDLFEGVQEHPGSVSFVGFIQFELNAYVQRIAPEYRNEILRYVTRFQGARRLYLSINLETLIASLLEKRKPEVLDKRFDSAVARQESHRLQADLSRWFPQARNHRLWRDPHQFHTILRKGCWPLSPFSTWFLFHLASAGKQLQQRSALSLLSDAISRYDRTLLPDGANWSLPPVELWSPALESDLLVAEEAGDQGSITHAYASTKARFGTRLEGDLDRILRAVVIASKMGLQAVDKADAIRALAQLSGVGESQTEFDVRLLHEELNVLEWDQGFRAFEILGAGVPRAEFLSLLRQRVSKTYDGAGRATLFARKATDWCGRLGDLDCDFAAENSITTREWRFRGVASSFEVLPMQVKLAADRWRSSFEVDEPRGTVIYCYVEPNCDVTKILVEVAELLRAAAQDMGLTAMPILVVFLCDEEGALGQALAEVAVLDESLAAEERARFGNLVPAHRERALHIINDQIERMIRQRHYCTPLVSALQSHLLSRVGTELFARIYDSAIPFPFDGFSTAKGNAADSCVELTSELLAGKLDFEAVIAKPVKTKNRALTVLQQSWGIFSKGGQVAKRPTHPTLRTITAQWDDALASGPLPIADAIKQLCLPPYGANLASAGLVLAAYVAPRVQNLLVLKGRQHVSILQLIEAGLFKGKFIDLSALRGVDLVVVGEVSSQWEALLDEWEQAESHLARRSCFQRAGALKASIPLPPSLIYREAHLSELAQRSCEAIVEFDRSEETTLRAIEAAYEKQDVANLARGAVSLMALVDKMKAESPAWTESQVAEIRPHIERARQAIVLHFAAWLPRQRPRANTPDAVGDFKHQMVGVVAMNLRGIGHEDLAQRVEKQTTFLVKNFDLVAEANQLLLDVSSWTGLHGHAAENPRVALLRELRHDGEDFLSRLKAMSEKLASKRVMEARADLAGYLGKLKEAEGAAVARVVALWKTKVATREDIDLLLAEVESLITVFTGVPSDLEDLLRMRGALRQYQTDHVRLASEDLDWNEFTRLAAQLAVTPTTNPVDGDVPWPRDVVIANFTAFVAQRRTTASADWIAGLETDAASVTSISAAEGERLYSRANKPPAFLTGSDLARLEVVKSAVENRLEGLQVDWLVERFRGLSPQLQQKFLLAISDTATDGPPLGTPGSARSKD